MKELVELLPEIILYVALGYSYNQSFKFVRILKKTKSLENLLTESLVVGFVLYNIFQVIPSCGNAYIDVVGMIIASIMLGYGVGAFVNSDIFDKVRKPLKIKQTPNSSIWKDIEDKNHAVFMRLENYEQKVIIDGKYVLGEAYERFPMVQLSAYRKYEDGEIVRDYKNQPYNTILVDTSKFDEVGIFYDTNSEKVKSW